MKLHQNPPCNLCQLTWTLRYFRGRIKFFDQLVGPLETPYAESVGSPSPTPPLNHYIPATKPSWARSSCPLTSPTRNGACGPLETSYAASVGSPSPTPPVKHYSRAAKPSWARSSCPLTSPTRYGACGSLNASWWSYRPSCIRSSSAPAVNRKERLRSSKKRDLDHHGLVSGGFNDQHLRDYQMSEGARWMFLYLFVHLVRFPTLRGRSHGTPAHKANLFFYVWYISKLVQEPKTGVPGVKMGLKSDLMGANIPYPTYT